MRNLFKLSLLATSLLGTMCCISDAVAGINLLSVQYFTASGNDFGTGGPQWGTFNNEVQSTLGVDGLPVLNPAYTGYISDVNKAGEILWWSPSLTLPTTTVTYTGSGTAPLPYYNSSFYPNNGVGTICNCDTQGFYQTAKFSGTINLPASEQVQFTFGADDDAFLYVDGTLVSSLGGIHGLSAAPVYSTTLGAGNHNLELFYADQMYTGAQLYFSVDTVGVTTAPVPEPETYAMLLAGLGLLGFMVPRKKSV